MSEKPGPPEVARTRQRLTKDERRRQLLGIGLAMLTERPIQEVSLDSVAEEAGISRGLLFHYFPTKTAFYAEVVAAAGRRVARTVRPDDGVTGAAAVEQLLERWVAQIHRRRALYLALVRGNLADLGGQEVAGSLREQMTEIVVEALAHDGTSAHSDVVHAWLAYVEDIALRWDATAAVAHAQEALAALVALTPPNPTR